MLNLVDMFDSYKGLEEYNKSLHKDDSINNDTIKDIVDSSLLKTLLNFYNRGYLYSAAESEEPHKKEETKTKPVLELEEPPIVSPIEWLEQLPTLAPLPPVYTNRVRAILAANNFNYLNFKTKYDLYVLEHPEAEQYRNILTSIAALESEFNNKAKNPKSTAKGYFQFLDGTENSYNSTIKNDKELRQIDLAVQHYQTLKNLLKQYKALIEESGLTPLQVMYGMWWRPESMLTFLQNGYDPYVNETDKMNLAEILRRAS